MQYLKKVYKLIQKWPIPSNITEVCTSLRFTNYYCRFIKKYAQVAKPLYKLISSENAARKQNSIKWSKNAKKSLTNLKSCALVHQFWPMQILENHSSYIQLQVFLALELSYTKERWSLKGY